MCVIDGGMLPGQPEDMTSRVVGVVAALVPVITFGSLVAAELPLLTALLGCVSSDTARAVGSSSPIWGTTGGPTTTALGGV